MIHNTVVARCTWCASYDKGYDAQGMYHAVKDMPVLGMGHTIRLFDCGWVVHMTLCLKQCNRLYYTMPCYGARCSEQHGAQYGEWYGLRCIYCGRGKWCGAHRRAHKTRPIVFCSRSMDVLNLHGSWWHGISQSSSSWCYNSSFADVLCRAFCAFTCSLMICDCPNLSM